MGGAFGGGGLGGNNGAAAMEEEKQDEGQGLNMINTMGGVAFNVGGPPMVPQNNVNADDDDGDWTDDDGDLRNS